jgi:tRNA(fMet)-specific endonuclease VapC
MYLLDTNHCSRIIDGDQNVIQALNNLGDTIVATCAIVRGELIYMAHKSDWSAMITTKVSLWKREI